MSFAQAFQVGDRRVGAGAPCFVIAEAGVNHFGSLEKAFALVDLAVSAGADALKIQHYRTDLLVGPGAADWRERLRTKELADADVLRIRDYCDRRGILFMCTAHDEDALDFLVREIDLPAFKIGSGEVGNWPWIESIARRGKPVILSTGMYDIADVKAAIDAVARAGNQDLALLHCVTQYPTDPKDANLAAMAEIRAVFEGPVGYSDHTIGTAVPLAAVALGAEIIEKHVTIDRDVPNAQDWKVSCDPSNFAKFVADIREIEAARGDGGKQIRPGEQNAIIWARKSLTARIDIPAGAVLDEAMLVSQRPGSGMAPFRIGELLGRRARKTIAAGTQLAPEMVE